VWAHPSSISDQKRCHTNLQRSLQSRGCKHLNHGGVSMSTVVAGQNICRKRLGRDLSCGNEHRLLEKPRGVVISLNNKRKVSLF